MRFASRVFAFNYAARCDVITQTMHKPKKLIARIIAWKKRRYLPFIYKNVIYNHFKNINCLHIIDFQCRFIFNILRQHHSNITVFRNIFCNNIVPAKFSVRNAFSRSLVVHVGEASKISFKTPPEL